MDTLRKWEHLTQLMAMERIWDSTIGKMNLVEEEFSYGQMGLNTWGIGRKGRLQAMEGLYMLMVMSTKVNGKMTKQTVMENMYIFLDQNIRVIGETI